MKNLQKKFIKCLRLISVEPTMWFFMMAFMTTSVIEQAFFMHKACRVDHGFSEKICRNLSDNKTLHAEVQVHKYAFFYKNKKKDIYIFTKQIFLRQQIENSNSKENLINLENWMLKIKY